jgi:hypothetical protein
MLFRKNLLETISLIAMSSFITNFAFGIEGPGAGVNDRYSQRSKGNFLKFLKNQKLADARFHIGLNAGINSPNAGNASDSPEFGINVGLQPKSPISVGAEVSTTTIDNNNNDNDYQRTTALMKGNYNFGGDIPIIRTSYVGAGAGPVFVDGKIEWAIAPQAGFDIPLNNRKLHDIISLGVNAKYLAISDEDDAGVLSGVVKYWY